MYIYIERERRGSGVEISCEVFSQTANRHVAFGSVDWFLASGQKSLVKSSWASDSSETRAASEDHEPLPDQQPLHRSLRPAQSRCLDST